MEKSSTLASELWPYLLPRIERLVQLGVGGGGGGSVISGAPTPHALSSTHHSGILADAQGPQFLKADGSRPLAGHLAVDAGILIDGVDISAHAANAAAHHALVTVGNTGIALSGQQVSLFLNATASGLEISTGLRLADSIAGAGLTIAAKVLAVGAGAGMTVNADDMALTTPGTLTVATTNAAAGNHTHAVTASSDVGTTPAAALLKSTAAGGLVLSSLAVKGSVDVTDGGDLTVGSNVLFVDVSQNSVGIGGQAPDPQFALDVNGPIRGTEIIGKHALQLKSVRLLMHFDGGYPYYSNYTGDLGSVTGEIRDLDDSGNLFRPGKFYKALVMGRAATNLITNPSFEPNTSGWTIYNDTGGDLAVARDATDSWFGDYSAKLTSNVLNSSQFYTATLATGDGTTPYTATVWLRADFTTTVRLRLLLNTSPFTTFGTADVTVTTAWQRFTVSGTPGSGAPMRFNIEPQTAGDIVWVDGVQVETGEGGPYIDGSLPGGSWSGLAHNSTSSRGNQRLRYPIKTDRVWTLMAWLRYEGNSAAIATSRGALLLADATGNNAIGLRLVAGGWRLTAKSNGGTAVDATLGGGPSWGAWQHVAITCGGGAAVTLRLNGGTDIEYASSIGGGALPKQLVWFLYLNQYFGGTDYGGFSYDDVVLLDRELTADEVRAVYESDAPVFAESSQRVFRATQRGLVWADEEGLWMRDYAGNPVMGFYGGEAATKSWGGLNLEVGDMLIGKSPAGYLHWDDSAEVLNVKGAIVITGGSGYANLSDKPTLGSLAAKSTADFATDVSGATKPANNATVGATWGTNLGSIPTTLGTPGVAGLYLASTGMGYWNGSAFQTYIKNDGKFFFNGESGARLAWDGTDLYGTDGTTVQWYARASTGKLYAGAGAVVIDASGVHGYAGAVLQWEGNTSGKLTAGAGAVTLDAAGINIVAPNTPGASNKIKWMTGAVSAAEIVGRDLSGISEHRLELYAGSVGNAVGVIYLDAYTGSPIAETILAIGYGLVETNGAFRGTGLYANTSAGLALKDDGGNVAATVLDGGSFQVNGKLGVNREALTISSGAITPSKSYVRLTSESGTTDDLTTINGGVEGDLLFLRPNTGHTITVKDGTGNINCAGDYVMNNLNDFMMLICIVTGGQWNEVARSDNV